jgi:hypothetical protein
MASRTPQSASAFTATCSHSKAGQLVCMCLSSSKALGPGVKDGVHPAVSQCLHCNLQQKWQVKLCVNVLVLCARSMHFAMWFERGTGWLHAHRSRLAPSQQPAAIAKQASWYACVRETALNCDATGWRRAPTAASQCLTQQPVAIAANRSSKPQQQWHDAPSPGAQHKCIHICTMYPGVMRMKRQGSSCSSAVPTQSVVAPPVLMSLLGVS